MLACKPAGRFGALLEHLRTLQVEAGDAKDALKPKGAIDEGAWLGAEEAKFPLDPRIPRLGGPHGARPCGHCQVGSRRETVYDRSAPCRRFAQPRCSVGQAKGS